MDVVPTTQATCINESESSAHEELGSALKPKRFISQEALQSADSGDTDLAVVPAFSTPKIAGTSEDKAPIVLVTDAGVYPELDSRDSFSAFGSSERLVSNRLEAVSPHIEELEKMFERIRAGCDAITAIISRPTDAAPLPEESMKRPKNRSMNWPEFERLMNHCLLELGPEVIPHLIG